MPLLANRADLDAKLETQRQIIEAARSAACGWVSFYIKERLLELEALFPGHTFTYTHLPYGGGLKVSPKLFGRKDLDEIADDLFVASKERVLNNAELRLSEIKEEVSDLSDIIEDEFKMDPGHIVSDEEIEEPVA